MAKKNLNARIQEYNNKLIQLRNQETLVMAKKEPLRALEISLTKLLNDQSNDQSEVIYFYKAYMEIRINLEDNDDETEVLYLFFFKYLA
jgi:hypothetical protein